MDESLSDFQETKKRCKGPKPAHKPNKPKTRKVTKRIKGQNDIRTALNGKKNELIKYCKEFDTVCKKSGLDVDSEQLQLAIALSKSLQTESTSTLENSQTLSSQDRVSKIRKTLQEYGFKVPEAKITVNKRIKKHRKQYKLLTITEEERHQTITGKYSQILFQNIDISKPEEFCIHLNSDARVFCIATNISYECMKDNSIFYINTLIEKSTTSGTLLRDWSEIPGRPVSPNLCEIGTMDFSEIHCSQDELDVILSGSMKSTKDIFATKLAENKNKHKECVVIDDDEIEISKENIFENQNNSIKIDNSPDQVSRSKVTSPFQKAFGTEKPVNKVSEEITSPVKEVLEMKLSPVKRVLVNPAFEEVIYIEASNKLTVTQQQYRSCSPDIFDDEISSVIETIKPINVLSQEHKTKLFTEDNFMDLTECANALSRKSERSIQLSQNMTKRRSNDFMEITDCIVGSSQPIRERFKDIDLTQSPEDAKIEGNPTNHSENSLKNVSSNLSSNDIEQASNELPLGRQSETSHQNNKKDIDLTQSSNEDDNRITVIADKNNLTPDIGEVPSMDLTQSSNSNDIGDLPLVNIGTSQTQQSLNETIIISTENYLEINGTVKKSLIFHNEENNHIDLTQEVMDNIKYPSPSPRFYEDFLHDHTDYTDSSEGNSQDKSSYSHSSSKKSKDIDLTQGSDTSEDVFTSQPITAVDTKSLSSHNIGSKEVSDLYLTQSSDTSEEALKIPKIKMVVENNPYSTSLGKRHDVSIDYDEIDDNISDQEIENENGKSQYECSKSDGYNNIETIDTNNQQDMSSSQNSEAFNISDKELDYSLHKSRYDIPRDNFDFGGISVLDNVTNLGSFRKSLSEGDNTNTAMNKPNYTMADSFLPEVDIKRTDEKCVDATQIDSKASQLSSPLNLQDIVNSKNGEIVVKTPKNTEYIIKTNDVTPMLDYASMSTPQRNRELDKYGLKPFKRKRAIQILTHIYNETHPTIQQLVDDDQPSPSKKPRKDYQAFSPKKLVMSPKTTPIKVQKLLQESPKKSKSSKSPENVEKMNVVIKSNTEQLRVFEENARDQSPKKSEGLGAFQDDLYDVTTEAAIIKSTDCEPDDWVFQKREKAKVHSCRVPLHIAFHNYVLSRRSLREAILKYEPVNIDIIHKDLVGYGHRYDPKDLLKFLDKKCITVKTTDNNSRNNKR